MRSISVFISLSCLFLLTTNCTDSQQFDFLEDLVTSFELNGDNSNNDAPLSKTCFALDDNTLGLWTFDESAGSGAINSVSSKDTLVFEKPSQKIDTDYGKAVALNSNSASLLTAPDYFPEKLTVEARVKIDRLPSASLTPRPHSLIVSTADWSESNCKGYELRLTDTDGKVEFVLGSSNGWISVISNSKLESDKWYSLAGQYDGNKITLFVDGEPVGETICTTPINKSSVGFAIGRRIVDQPFYFYGSIDEVAISNTCRYNCFEDNWYTTDYLTIAHWTFNSLKNNIIEDISGNKHDAACSDTPVLVPGDAGNALHFKQNHCTVITSSAFYPKFLTVEAAVKLDSYPSANMSPRPHMMIVSTTDWSGNDCEGYELRISDSNGKIEFIFGDENGWHCVTTEKTLPINEWHSLAGQYDGRTISVFVDGQLWGKKEYINKIQYCNTNIGIARRLVDQPFYFNGSVDEIRISGTIRY